MDDTLLFIPPCCVSQKLPQAIMAAPHRALTFHTHGDVMVDKLYRAVSYLVQEPHVMVLTMPIVSTDTLVFIEQCFDRGWITDLVLSTSRDISGMIDTYLSSYRKNILYSCNNDVADISSHLVLYSNRQALMIAGPMWDRIYNVLLATYKVFYYPNYDLFSTKSDWSHPLHNILLPDILRHRRLLAKFKIILHSDMLEHFIHMELPPYKDED